MQTNSKKLVRAALFMALTCAATLIIHIPTPGTGGYIHPGDAFVILSGVFLGPKYGFLAAGLGSAMADLFGGYAFYAPVTLLIKGLSAFLSALLFRYESGKGKDKAGLLLSGLANLILVPAGYLIFEYSIYSAAALASVPANLLQGLGGLILSLILYPLLLPIRRNLDS